MRVIGIESEFSMDKRAMDSRRIVCVNGRFLSRRMTGVDRFAFEVLRALDVLIEHDDEAVSGVVCRLVSPLSISNAKKIGSINSVGFGKRVGLLWEQVDFRRIKGADVLLSLCNTGPIFSRKQVVVIHDAATVSCPQSFDWKFRWWYRILMPLLGFASRRIITVSNFSANDLVKCFGIPRHKISVVAESGEHILRVEPDLLAIERFGLNRRPFVFAVSSMAAHKNFRLVLDAISKIDDPPFDVAIAGGANKKVFGTAGMIESDCVKWLGYVSDAELRALYENAICFVFPSLYEGFGIPPLEAMHCGCPVLASRAGSIPEVCGDAAQYFDPEDPDELARLLLRVSDDAELRVSLRKIGLNQASKFSWDAAARQIISACNEVF